VCVSALILILILILQMLPLPPLALLPLQPASARTAGLASLSIAWPVPPAALVASQLSTQQQLLLLHQYQLCQAHPLLLPLHLEMRRPLTILPQGFPEARPPLFGLPT
jgi:hypothetical protein